MRKLKENKLDFFIYLILTIGAAVAQVCYQRRIPCIVIRSISDKADEESLVDVDKFIMLAATNSATLVAQMVEMSLKD